MDKYQPAVAQAISNRKFPFAPPIRARRNPTEDKNHHFMSVSPRSSLAANQSRTE